MVHAADQVSLLLHDLHRLLSGTYNRNHRCNLASIQLAPLRPAVRHRRNWIGKHGHLATSLEKRELSCGAASVARIGWRERWRIYAGGRNRRTRGPGGDSGSDPIGVRCACERKVNEPARHRLTAPSVSTDQYLRQPDHAAIRAIRRRVDLAMCAVIGNADHQPLTDTEQRARLIRAVQVGLTRGRPPDPG